MKNIARKLSALLLVFVVSAAAPGIEDPVRRADAATRPRPRRAAPMAALAVVPLAAAASAAAPLAAAPLAAWAAAPAMAAAADAAVDANNITA